MGTIKRKSIDGCPPDPTPISANPIKHEIWIKPKIPLLSPLRFMW